jgi:hypothetical protein
LEAKPGDLLAGDVWDRIVARADARKNKGS